jgi:hypothetical protein
MNIRLLRCTWQQLALSRHANGTEQCLLSGAKQTSPKEDVMSAHDPKRTSGNPSCRASHLGRGQIAAGAIDMCL